MKYTRFPYTQMFNLFPKVVFFYIFKTYSKLVTKWKVEFQHLKLSKGTTLIELLLYMGLLTVFLGVLSSLFGTAIDIQLGTQATSGVTNDSNYLLKKLTYDIQRAQSVTTPASLGQNTSVLVLRINNINHTYALDSDGNLTYTNNLGTFILNTYSVRVSAINFLLLGNLGGTESSVKVDLTITSRINQPKGAETRDVSTTVSVRRNI